MNSNRKELARNNRGVAEAANGRAKPARVGEITDDEVAVYYSVDLQICHLADEKHREGSSR